MRTMFPYLYNLGAPIEKFPNNKAGISYRTLVTNQGQFKDT